MALTKCKECGEAISKKAKACPKCGSPPKKETSLFTKLVASLFVIGLIGMFFSDPASRSPSGATTKPAAPKTAAELRSDKIANQFSPWDGSHRMLEGSVEKSLKDPDSYEHIETTFADKGDYILVRMSFRAKNSFGGYVVQVAEGKYDINGNSVEPPHILE